jgi:hypothetical protein
MVVALKQVRLPQTGTVIVWLVLISIFVLAGQQALAGPALAQFPEDGGVGITKGDRAVAITWRSRGGDCEAKIFRENHFRKFDGEWKQIGGDDGGGCVPYDLILFLLQELENIGRLGFGWAPIFAEVVFRIIEMT